MASHVQLKSVSDKLRNYTVFPIREHTSCRIRENFPNGCNFRNKEKKKYRKEERKKEKPRTRKIYNKISLSTKNTECHEFRGKQKVNEEREKMGRTHACKLNFYQRRDKASPCALHTPEKDGRTALRVRVGEEERGGEKTLFFRKYELARKHFCNNTENTTPIDSDVGGLNNERQR